ncbi:MAG: UbiA prenyltransferase family protein [Candidatus Binatia bacterium]|jgi:decaprenyl-phosphate phosphoribosyltransferase
MSSSAEKHSINPKLYFRIARVDHWFKNVFVLPGTLIAAVFFQIPFSRFASAFVIGILSTCLIASANYVINEWLDAEFDCFHPVKKNRPSVIARLSPFLVLTEYVLLLAAGFSLGNIVGKGFLMTTALFALMGVLYNVKPFRTKDKAYVDVLSESVNNPIRLALGWFIVSDMQMPPSSPLMTYWMGGAYLMAIKRYAEYRFIGNPELASKYRRSFKFYDENRLLVSAFFYALSAAFFGGVFLIKYRIELLLTFPFLAVLFAWYLAIGMKPDSAAQHPEQLYKEPRFIAYVLFVAILVTALFIIDVPSLAWFLNRAFIATPW